MPGHSSGPRLRGPNCKNSSLTNEAQVVGKIRFCWGSVPLIIVRKPRTSSAIAVPGRTEVRLEKSTRQTNLRGIRALLTND